MRHPLRRALLSTTFLLCGLAFSAEALNAADGHAPSSDAERQAPQFPGIQGNTLDGNRLSTSSFAGKRLVVLCFNPALEQAETYAKAVASLESERSRYNFEILGIALGLSSDPARRFAERLKLNFPILDDSKGNISSGMGLQSPLALFAVGVDGSIGFSMGALQASELQPTVLVENQLREFLRLPTAQAKSGGELERRPLAPLFETKRLGGGGLFRLADLKGKPVVLIFFSHTCSHCHEALTVLKEALAKIPAASRPTLVGVSFEDHASEVNEALKGSKLDFFTVVVDPRREVGDAYGVFSGTPDTLFIDSNGRIAHRIGGWNDERSPSLAKMYLALIAQVPVPMLINDKGFSGNDVCSACHTAQAATWEFTSHAAAFNSLVPLGSERDTECIGCHVVGFEKPGGYSLEDPTSYTENVGCETCHGQGGPHRKGGVAAQSDYRNVCLQCHNPKHSMGFEYETFLPKVSHAAIAALDPAAREALVAGRGVARDLLPVSSKIVGSAACKGCHHQEYATWSRSPHARAIESLKRARKDDEAECQRCHVTGFGRPGGFQQDVRVKNQPELAQVGCESCHGPGEEHVKKGAQRVGSIVKLGDKCDSCVILQICGTCHDDANDPEFRFNVKKRVDAQRHGVSN